MSGRAEASVQNSQGRPLPSDLEPPAYDTLSIAPPSESFPYAERPENAGNNEHDIASEKKSLKEKWRIMKEEDRRRKNERIQHVTPEEADRITGLAKRREEQARNAKKGGRGLLSFSIFC